MESFGEIFNFYDFGVLHAHMDVSCVVSSFWLLVDRALSGVEVLVSGSKFTIFYFLSPND
jgi:hypothetical protein